MSSYDWHNLIEFVYGVKLINTKRTKDMEKSSKEETKGEEFEVEDELPAKVE
jgi:hypothetical protein